MKADLEQQVEPAGQNAEVPSQSDWGKTATWLVLLFLFALLFVVFSGIALKRPADVDEGFHLVCGKSIFVEGRSPYLDFFFFQMPLLPYVYGGIMGIFGYKWAVARLFCAFLAAAIGVLLCKHALEKTGSLVFAASIGVLYCLAPYIFIWFTCARTHVLSTFFLAASICLLPPISRRSSEGLYAISGFLLGLSVDTRLYFAVLIPLMAFHVSRIEKKADGRALLLFLGGAGLALMANLPFLIVSPLKFLLNVVGYHAIKTPEGFIGSFGQKVDLLLQMFFDYPNLRPTLYLGYVVIFIVYLAHQALRRAPLGEWNPAFYAVGALFLVSLLPTPALGQYFCVPVPFFLLLATDLFKSLLEYLKPAYLKRVAVGVVALGAVLFAYKATDKINFYILEANNLEGSMPTEGGKDDWSLANVERVSRTIDKLVRPDATVFSLWSGYLLESHVRVMPKTENVTLLEIEDKLSEKMIVRSQTITDAEIRTAIYGKKIDLFVSGNSIAPYISEYKALLSINGYTLAGNVGGTSLFLSPRYGRHPTAQSTAAPRD